MTPPNTAPSKPDEQPATMSSDSIPQPVDEKKESPSADGYMQHEAPMHAVPPMMNGMPPQQVYVNTAMVHHGMMGLEAQFHGLGMNETQEVSNRDDSDGNDHTGEGSNDEEPIKLFIGQVSRILLKPNSFARG